MMRKKVIALVCMLIAACLVLAGCKMVSNYALKVNDTIYTEADAQAYANYYASFSDSEEAIVSDAADAMTDTALIRQKAAENGIALTADELSAIAAQAEEARENELSSFIFYAYYMYNDSGMSYDDIASYYRDLFNRPGFRTQDYTARLTAEALEEKLISVVTADVTVTDADVQAAYDADTSEEALADIRTQYDADFSACANAIQNGETVLYRPTDYRLVRQILIQYDEAFQTEVDDLRAQLEDLDAQIAALQPDESVEAVEESVEAADEFVEAAQDPEALKQQRDDLQAKLDVKLNEAFASISDEADAVVAAARAGEDWDALVAEHNDDPGMAAGAPTAGGYVIYDGASYDEPFINAALALQAEGDISEPTRGTFHGLYIVRLVKELPAGVVPLDEIRDTLEADLLHEKRHEAFDKLLEQWASEAEIVRDTNRIKVN